ncbi:hypothetical protein [Dysgonomonas sp. ZJ279]|uniref:hypothetical protein n=1 Tax=Dysgonomonas sp. ZJ279 TaxID=2709796 RepID=UPI0013EB5120|nr:hypothetical protein [Dysgonomonas sp. ZJ279]
MAQSVSNDALWEKLCELDKKLEKFAITQKSLTPQKDQSEIKIDFGETKDEIIAKIKGDIRILGLSSDSHFEANSKNIQQLTEDVKKTLGTVAHIRKQQKETAESQKTDDTHFNFRFFKVRKSSLVIGILGLLVFTLTLFCMKQQNDYSLLMNEYYRQSVVVREMQTEMDSLKNNARPDTGIRKKQ